MFYFLIYSLFYPFLFLASFFRKKGGKNLVIQSAKIGDYVNSSIIFDVLEKLDIVLDEQNLEFANYDDRIECKFGIKDAKKRFFSKIKLGLKLFFNNYKNVYVLTPNGLNLFLAKFAFCKNVVTISHEFNGSSFKILSTNMKKVEHKRDELTLKTYLKMVGIFKNIKVSDELKNIDFGFKRIVQRPIFKPKNEPNFSNKFKVGISLSAANTIKTPPSSQWSKIFKILSNFDCEIFIFGIKNEGDMLKDIDIYGNGGGARSSLLWIKYR